MKTRFRDWLRLRPFDESAESDGALGAYSQSPLLMVAAVATVLLAVAAAGLAIAGFPQAFDTIRASIAAGAVTAGLEWNAGLKARALNHMFMVLLLLGILGTCQVVFG